MPLEKLEQTFREALQEMSPASLVAECGSLTRGQVRTLTEQGCWSPDWSRVLLSPGSSLENVSGCRFLGDVRLCLAPACTPGETREAAIRDSTLQDVDVGPGCRIISVGELRNMVLEESVTLEHCGSVTFSQGSACGSGHPLRLGVETGERNVQSFPLLDTGLAATLSGGMGRASLLHSFEKMMQDFLEELRGAARGSLRSGSSITCTPVVRNSYIGPGASVDNAAGVRNSTLLSGARVTDGALVRDSILKWGAVADSMALVQGSVLDEASMVEKQGKLTDSFLGPNSVLGEGEITASLAGPFTACHHQSLLIAARWPEGRGNLGYGANVGSNHTSRLPDQEIRPGEGMFFGLACSVKFPADFSMAPYSIIATGVTTLPQRMEFPFSLICSPFLAVPGIPPAYNQIIPAWMLSSNLFAVCRNDEKFRDRDRTVRTRSEHIPVIREETVGLMIRALDLLKVDRVRDVYTDREIPGLGKNFLTEEHRTAAQESYTFHTGLYALEALDDNGIQAAEDPLAGRILGDRFADESPDRLLEIRRNMRERVKADLEQSRSRDHVRGSCIIGDYLSVRGITL